MGLWKKTLCFLYKKRGRENLWRNILRTYETKKGERESSCLWKKQDSLLGRGSCWTVFRQQTVPREDLVSFWPLLSPICFPFQPDLTVLPSSTHPKPFRATVKETDPAERPPSPPGVWAAGVTRLCTLSVCHLGCFYFILLFYIRETWDVTIKASFNLMILSSLFTLIRFVVMWLGCQIWST